MPKFCQLNYDHNVDETLSISVRANLLCEGRILKAGTPQELADDEQVRRVYWGSNFKLKGNLGNR